MLTRCPSCATHFRVTPEQLKARSGRVRCGECQNVFNALDSLIEEPVLVIVPPAAEASPVTSPVAEADIPAQALADSASRPDEIAVPPAPTFEPAPEPILEMNPEATAEPESEAIVATAGESIAEPLAEPATEFAGTGIAAKGTPLEAAAEDQEIALPEPPPPSRRWPWVAGSLVALATLVLQAALVFRVELAVLQPDSRPVLEFLCEFAACEVGLPARVGLVGIEASDLHPDSEHKGRLALAATLKNRAPFHQQFPHLELTLTDTVDQAIARKVLAPADYLPTTAIAGGMKPGTDIMVTIGIDPGSMAASGYRLYLFYP